MAKLNGDKEHMESPGRRNNGLAFVLPVDYLQSPGAHLQVLLHSTKAVMFAFSLKHYSYYFVTN